MPRPPETERSFRNDGNITGIRIPVLAAIAELSLARHGFAAESDIRPQLLGYLDRSRLAGPDQLGRLTPCGKPAAERDG
jgi:hypothetical protein